MPRPRRPQPGSVRGHRSGGGIDLGAILDGYFGGVESNPDFGKGASVGDEGPLPPPKTADQPYKPRAFWNKGEAARMNADFKVGEFQADKDVDRNLRQEEGMTPIINQRAAFTNALAQALMRATNNSQLVTNKGILDTDRNQADYDTSVSNEAMNAAAQDYLAKAAASQASGLQSALASDITKATANDQLGTAQTEASTARALATGNNLLVPEVLTNKKIGLREGPLHQAMEAKRGSVIPIGPDTTLYDAINNKTITRTPSEMQSTMDFLERRKQGQQPPVTTSQQPQGEVVEGEVIRIGGKLYLRQRK